LAISKALDASTLAATKAAEAAAAAASIAASTSKDLEYIKADIAATKLDIKSINEKLDNKYVSKEDFRPTKDIVDKIEDKYVTKQELLNHSIANETALSDIKKILEKLVTIDQFSTVKTIVYGMCGLILIAFMSGLIYLVLRPHP
jgi:phosphoribosylaminoimidazole carboxylase (NCAIR synthetase)